MARGLQAAQAAAKGQARNAAQKKAAMTSGEKAAEKARNNAIIAEKQRRSDLIKQGIDPDAGKEAPKKTWDDSYLKQYEVIDEEEEEKKEETLEEAKEASGAQEKKGHANANKQQAKAKEIKAPPLSHNAQKKANAEAANAEKGKKNKNKFSR